MNYCGYNLYNNFPSTAKLLQSPAIADNNEAQLFRPLSILPIFINENINKNNIHNYNQYLFSPAVAPISTQLQTESILSSLQISSNELLQNSLFLFPTNNSNKIPNYFANSTPCSHSIFASTSEIDNLKNEEASELMFKKENNLLKESVCDVSSSNNDNNYYNNWCNEEIENEKKTFRDYLKVAAYEFKRSVESNFENKRINDMEMIKDKKSNARESKKIQKQAEMSPTTTLSNSSSLNFVAANFSGMDRFSPSSVSCASIDSGFSEATCSPPLPDSSSFGQTASAATSFSSLHPAAVSNSPTKSEFFCENLEESLTCNRQATKRKLLYDKTELKENNFHLNDENKDDSIKNAASCNGKPATKVPKISDIFFNSKDSFFVNNLLKRSENHPSSNNDDEVRNVSIENQFSKLRTEKRCFIILPMASNETIKAIIKCNRHRSINSDHNICLEREKTANNICALSRHQPIAYISKKDNIDMLKSISIPASSITAENRVPIKEVSTKPNEDVDESLFDCGCLWQECSSRFRTDNELYDHVRQHHLEKLRPKNEPESKQLTRQKVKSNTAMINKRSTENPLVCQWDNCEMCLKRGDHYKQFEWLIEHYTTRHAPRAQPFACLFENCNLRFRLRRSLNDHLRSAHDSKRPNGKRNSNFNNNLSETSYHCYNYQPRVQLPSQADIIDRRTMNWIREQLKVNEIINTDFKQENTTEICKSKDTERDARSAKNKFTHNSAMNEKTEINDADVIESTRPGNKTMQIFTHKMKKTDVSKMLSELFNSQKLSIRVSAQ